MCVGLGVGFGVDLLGDEVGFGEWLGDVDGDFDGDFEVCGELFETLGETLGEGDEDVGADGLGTDAASFVRGRSQPTIPTPSRTSTAAVTTATATRPFLGMPEDDVARCDRVGPSPGGGEPVVTPRCRVGGPSGPAGAKRGPDGAA